MCRRVRLVPAGAHPPRHRSQWSRPGTVDVVGRIRVQIPQLVRQPRIGDGPGQELLSSHKPGASVERSQGADRSARDGDAKRLPTLDSSEDVADIVAQFTQGQVRDDQPPDQMVNPPSTDSTAPVVYDDSSEAKKAMDAAISAGVAKPKGDMILVSSLKSAPSGSPNEPIIGVSTPPGATTFTRTPLPRYSAASALENISTPAL